MRHRQFRAITAGAMALLGCAALAQEAPRAYPALFHALVGQPLKEK